MAMVMMFFGWILVLLVVALGVVVWNRFLVVVLVSDVVVWGWFLVMVMMVGGLEWWFRGGLKR